MSPSSGPWAHLPTKDAVRAWVRKWQRAGVWEAFLEALAEPCTTPPRPSLPPLEVAGKQQVPVDVRTGKGLPPVLIVQSERDAATPYEGAVELHMRLQGSRLITEKDAGSHGVTNTVTPASTSGWTTTCCRARPTPPM
ncbi:hypothetical protein GCM10020367_07790 [Streptomyces sannanensis]|uniref:Peptidase S33 tripeptidyl aminopeptidase-like C-terminal domain-containing protein n=1 Tax=Streptomyces sannanensis TaxID=285536 RepID=A0ABP6S5K4_9ACTN